MTKVFEIYSYCSGGYRGGGEEQVTHPKKILGPLQLPIQKQKIFTKNKPINYKNLKKKKNITKSALLKTKIDLETQKNFLLSTQWRIHHWAMAPFSCSHFSLLYSPKSDLLFKRVI